MRCSPGARAAHPRSGSLGTVDPGPGISQQDDAGRPQAAQLDFDAWAQRLEQARERSQTIMDRIQKGQSQRERLRDSAFARLQARLRSMPAIEQAKGILMAQHRCGPDEAFEILRHASQHANVRVSVLAARMVEQIAAPGPDGRR